MRESVAAQEALLTSPVVSVLICTRNRADALRQTLLALAGLCVPDQMPCELIVVDNASTDDTAQVAQRCVLPNMAVRYVYEAQAGQSRARNTGLAAAQGRVLLFTDDDVRPPADWIAGMCGPILRGEADAVAGSVRFAPHLVKEWMTPAHRVRLAETGVSKPFYSPDRMTGANMAFGKHVLARVPAFDTELGPGALGFMDDTLFSRQLLAAGYRMAAAYDVPVEHHFDASRLSYASLLKMAQGHEHSNAYVAWHWEHQEYKAVHVRLLVRRLKLALLRLTRLRERQGEAPPPWEENHLGVTTFFRQYLIERRRPRNYEKHGLVKKTAQGCDQRQKTD